MALDVDPTFGTLREPILKVIQLLRSLEYTAKNDAEVSLYDLYNKLGTQPYAAPSVFGFYLPSFVPDGPLGEQQLVAPEAELLTSPRLLNFVNGITSLIDFGLTTCDSGFADPISKRGRKCGRNDKVETADGPLAFIVDTASQLDPATHIVDEVGMYRLFVYA